MMSTLFDRLQIDLEELKREQRKFKEGLDVVMQSLEKLTLEDNEKITVNSHNTTKIGAPANQVRETIAENRNEASDIDTSDHIRHTGF